MLNHLKATWNTLIKQYHLWAFCSAVDLVYFVCFAYALRWFLVGVEPHIRAVFAIFNDQLRYISDITPEAAQLLLQNQDQLLYHYGQFAYYLGIISVLTLLLYGVFQGITWFVAHKINGHKVDPKVYIKNVLIVTVCGAVLIAAILAGSVQASIQVVRSPIPLLDIELLNWGSVVGFIVAIYLISSGYAVAHEPHMHRKMLKYLFTDGARKLFAFALCGTALLLANVIVWRLLSVNMLTTLLFTTLILLPLYTFCRTFFMRFF